MSDSLQNLLFKKPQAPLQQTNLALSGDLSTDTSSVKKVRVMKTYHRKWNPTILQGQQMTLEDEIQGSEDAPVESSSLENALGEMASDEFDRALRQSQADFISHLPEDDLDNLTDTEDLDEIPISLATLSFTDSREHLKQQFKVSPRTPVTDKSLAGNAVSFNDSLTPWMDTLVSLTGTQKCLRHLKAGLAEAVFDLGGSALANAPDKWGVKSARMISISIWLTICYRFHCKITSLDDSAAEACRYLLHAAVTLESRYEVKNRSPSIVIDDLKHNPSSEGELLYWEQQLRKASSQHFRQWFDTLPLHEELSRYKPRNADEKQWMEILEGKGLYILGDHLMIKESEQRQDSIRNVYTLAPKQMRREMARVFVNAGAQVTAALIRNDILVRSQRPNDPVCAELSRVDQSASAPGIYGNFLADPSGMAPTPLHMKLIVSDIRKYLNDSTHLRQWRHDLDRMWYPPYDIDQHDYRYLRTERKERSSARVATLESFCKIQERLANNRITAGLALAPSTVPITNIGYSKKPTARLEKHARHESSNYVMNLSEAVLIQRFGPSLCIRQLRLYTCFYAEQAWFSEIGITQVVQGYIDSGYGFSHAKAGCSNRSMYEESTEAQEMEHVRANLSRMREASVAERDRLVKIYHQTIMQRSGFGGIVDAVEALRRLRRGDTSSQAE